MSASSTHPAGGPALEASLAYSRDALCLLRERLTAAAEQLSPLVCVAAAGSLARGEAGPSSDVDCVIVAHGHAADAAVDEAVQAVLDVIRASPLRAPAADGIFRQAVREDALLDPGAAGSLAEPPSVYGKRLQMLTDTVPMFGAGAYRKLRERILHWYLRLDRPSRSFEFLASELVRYRRSYWAWQTGSTAGRDDGPARLRLAKLDSTRLVTVAGLLFLLGAAAGRADAAAFVLSRLDLSPLERILDVLAADAPAQAERLRTLYGTVHATLESPASRQALGAGGDAGGTAQAAERALFATVSELRSEVNAALLGRRHDWPAWFFETLLL